MILWSAFHVLRGTFPIQKQINAKFVLLTAKNVMKKVVRNVSLAIIYLREFAPFVIVHVKNVTAEDRQAVQTASLQPCFLTAFVGFVRVSVVVVTSQNHKAVILAWDLFQNMLREDNAIPVSRICVFNANQPILLIVFLVSRAQL